MPTLPEEEEEGGEEQDSIPSAVVNQITAVETRTNSTPSILLPEVDITADGESNQLLKNRPHSPTPRHSSRHSRTSFSSVSSLTSVGSDGHVIDLVHDQLPNIKLSHEDKRKNLELLEEAKKVSEQFHMRRGRRSRSSLSDSPTGLYRNNELLSCGPLMPGSNADGTTVNCVGSVPQSQHLEVSTFKGQNESLQLDSDTAKNDLMDGNYNDQRKVSQGRLIPCSTSSIDPLEIPEQKEKVYSHNFTSNPSESNTSTKNTDSNKASLGFTKTIAEDTLGATNAKPKEHNVLSMGTRVHGPDLNFTEVISKVSSQDQSGLKDVCRTECKPLGSHPPLLRAVSWDNVESGSKEKGAPKAANTDEGFSFMDKSSGYKDFPVQPVKMQKLTKLREDNKIMRNQSLVGLKLPDLSEAAEQERGPSPVPPPSTEEESKGNGDVMPSIPDSLLRKLRVQRSLSGSSPPLSEKEVENVFVQLSLAFKNDSYTLETRLRQAEKERNLTEENTEKELEDFKGSVKTSVILWQHPEHREAYERLIESIAVLHRLSIRLSSRAEMVGAVRQEKRMSKATEVMMQYVENLKRTYEKDHAELIEFKKLANQNSNRSYGGPANSDDGVPRGSRSMSLSLGKNMPRRRVSVAVVPKFNLLNIPGQSPNTSSSLPSVSESNSGKSSTSSNPAMPSLMENGQQNGNQEVESPAPGQTQSIQEEISPEIRAKIEEEAFSKGYQEGLKRSKELQDLKEEGDEKTDEITEEKKVNDKKEMEEENKEKEEEEEQKKISKIEEATELIKFLYPTICKHWKMIWIMGILLVIFAALRGVYNFYSCNNMADVAHGKSTCSAVQNYFWWNSGLQYRPRNPE
ncbi:inositol 1,4,5-triphosphate receptor associated 1 [Latimeria chalumnae]|uniref:inositol 1,4,5-triphosphate receptor associated 1 n=1 Tax=Latimeria chalumnae TaxID=7897 RepID=UPI00313EBBB3